MLSNSLLGFHSLCPATAVGWTESDAKKADNPSPQLSDTSDIKIKNSHTGQGGDGGRKLCVEKTCFALSCRNSSQRVRAGRRNVHVCVHHVDKGSVFLSAKSMLSFVSIVRLYTSNTKHYLPHSAFNNMFFMLIFSSKFSFLLPCSECIHLVFMIL